MVFTYFSVAVLCPVLGDIANGAVTVTSRTVGSRATYTCNDGYRLQGDRQRESVSEMDAGYSHIFLQLFCALCLVT